jgi:Sensors of blue-light using FAD
MGAERAVLIVVLERLLYQSIASYELGSLHLFTLLSRARVANQRLGITGHLLYAGGRFVQCIEGPPDSIEHLWQKLNVDDRHHDVILVNRAPVKVRRFPEWSMAFSSHPTFNDQNMEGFFPLDEHESNEFTVRCASHA